MVWLALATILGLKIWGLEEMQTSGSEILKKKGRP